MLCKNCNYILTGKENYCPNCAAPLKKEPPDTVKDEPEKPAEDIQDDVFIGKKYVFPEARSEEFKQQKPMHIFADLPEGEEERPQQKKSYGARIVLLLFLTCAFAVGAFAVIDYFDITSSVFSFISSSAQPKEKETSESLFNHNSSVVKPDISYTPSAAYVMSGKGLTLRKGPDKSYAPLANLSDLTEVQVYGASASQEEWVYVYCSETGSYGWLDGSFLARDAAQQEALPAISNTQALTPEG